MYVVFRCQVDKLLEAGANLLTPVAVGSQRQIGTAVDYAHYVYSLASMQLSVLVCRSCRRMQTLLLLHRTSRSLLRFWKQSR